MLCAPLKKQLLCLQADNKIVFAARYFISSVIGIAVVVNWTEVDKMPNWQTNFLQVYLVCVLCYNWTFNVSLLSYQTPKIIIRIVRVGWKIVCLMTYVTSPRSIIPPNSWAVICNSFSGYWGKNLYSSNRFLSIQLNTSCNENLKITKQFKRWITRLYVSIFDYSF